MTHNLLLNYGLYRKMEIYVSMSNRICSEAFAVVFEGFQVFLTQIGGEKWK